MAKDTVVLTSEEERSYLFAKEKSTRVAYLLWVLSIFGWWGFHRFYLNRPKTGILWFVTVGMYGVGCIADLFLIPGMVETENRKAVEARRCYDEGQRRFKEYNTSEARAAREASGVAQPSLEELLFPNSETSNSGEAVSELEKLLFPKY